MQVVKGPDAEAIYGARAKNGVIFITLKKDEKITIAPSREEKSQTEDRISAIKSLVEDAQKKNILFVGLENHLPVQYKGVPDDQLVASLDQGHVSMKGSIVSIKPISPGTARLTISRQTSYNSKPVVLETRTYAVKFLPAPNAMEAFRAVYL
nr:GldM family protein [Paraflavitalea sp. H1-2-19X]